MRLLIPLLFLALPVAGQQKTYVLQEKTEHGDINQELFDQFGSPSIYENRGLERAFEPIEGDYEVYVFEAEYIGASFDGSTKLFHDKLILKVDPDSGIILDGYQYTMEWADPPPVYDLYRVSASGVYISRNLLIEDLDLLPVIGIADFETQTGRLRYSQGHKNPHKNDMLFVYSYTPAPSEWDDLEVSCELINTSADTVYFLSTTCDGLQYSILYDTSILEMTPRIRCNGTSPKIESIAPKDTLSFTTYFKLMNENSRVDLFYDFFEVEAGFSLVHMNFGLVHNRRGKSILVGVEKNRIGE